MEKDATFLTVKNKSLQQEFQINTDDILYAMKTEEESHAKPWIYMIDGKQFSYPNSMGTLEEELGKEFIRISRQCIVASKAIHSVTKEYILLNTGSVSIPKEGNIPTYAVLEDGIFTIKGFEGEIVKTLDLNEKGTEKA